VGKGEGLRWMRGALHTVVILGLEESRCPGSHGSTCIHESDAPSTGDGEQKNGRLGAFAPVYNTEAKRYSIVDSQWGNFSCEVRLRSGKIEIAHLPHCAGRAKAPCSWAADKLSEVPGRIPTHPSSADSSTMLQSINFNLAKHSLFPSGRWRWARVLLPSQRPPYFAATVSRHHDAQMMSLSQSALP
jgi:hypothetical protein